MDITKYIGLEYIIPTQDCWGIVRSFAKEQLSKNYPQFFYTEINNEQTAQTIMGAVDFMDCWYKVEKPELGDVLIFRIKNYETHCGIYLQDGDFLHSLQGRMSCIENLNDSNWNRRHTRTYRWLGS
jgi:cell wall-associated NlpC family hydrolase